MMCVCMFVFDVYFLVQTRRFDTCTMYLHIICQWLKYIMPSKSLKYYSITFWLTNHPGDRWIWAHVVAMRNLQDFFSRRPQGRVQVQQANTQKKQEKPLKNTKKKHATPNKKKMKTLNFGRFFSQRCHPQLYRFALVWRWCQSKRRHS